MSMRQLWEGGEASPWLKELSGATKLSGLFLFSILLITVDNPRTLFYLFTVVLILHLVAGTSLAKWRLLAVLLLLGLWGSMFSQALFYSQTPRTPLAVLLSPTFPLLGDFTGGIYIYREGVIYGAVQGLRSAAMLTLGLLICWNSDPRKMLLALRSWHMPPQLAFMLVTAMRFLPVLAAEAGEVMIALRLRSGKVSGRRSIIRHLPYVARPLLSRSVRRAQTLALSVVSRGLLSADDNYEQFKWPLREKCCCLLLAAVAGAVVAAKLLYMASEQGLYYGNLRQIYDWTRLYL